MIEFNAIFEGARVPAWLREFERAPVDAVEALLVGRADLGLLSAEEPSTLLLDWLAGIGDQDGFAREIDEALASWIRRSWGNPTLEKANQSASLTSVAWCRAADVIAMDERLDDSADCLRQMVINDRRFLNTLHEGRGRDPMARAWLAIARHQRDRNLVNQWWGLCSLPPDEPWYRGAYGIHGLRGLPPVDELKKGGFSEEVAEGLAMLARALLVRQDEGWLEDKVGQNEFLRTARMTMAAYPFPKEWQSFWRHAVDRNENQAPRDWIKKIARLTSGKRSVRGGGSKFSEHRNQTKQWTEPDLQWPGLAGRIASRLALADWSVLADAKELLHVQTKFAEKTGNTAFAVRTACNFAGKVRETRPGLALEWAELARRLEPWSAYGWTTSAGALLMLGKYSEAQTLALQSVDRFPESVYARCVLAEVLKAQQRFDEAESVYRATTVRFPESAYAWVGLGEALKAQQRFDEAESVYRTATVRFPESTYALVGLGEALKAQQRFDEAELVYRAATVRFPESTYAWVGLGESLRAQQRFDEAELVYRATIVRFPDDAIVLASFAGFLNARGRFGEAALLRANFDKTHEPVNAPLPTDSFAPQRIDVPATPAKVRGSPEELRADDITILLSDAYLLRRWQSRTMHSEDHQPPSALHDRALHLLENLMPLIGTNSRAASEAGLITLAHGDWEEAVQLLSQASERFRGSVRVHYSLARAQRELARSEQRALSAEAEMDVIEPWRRLRSVDEHCRPVQLLGEGRAWLTLRDGATVDEHARNAFGRLGHWLSRQIEPTDEEVAPNATSLERIRGRFALRDQADHFFGWWAREVQTYLFGESLISRAEDLEELAPIRERIAQYSSTLDQIEEECVGRFERA